MIIPHDFPFISEGGMDELTRATAVFGYLINHAGPHHSINATGIGESMESMQRFISIFWLFFHLFGFHESHGFNIGDAQQNWLRPMTSEQREALLQIVPGFEIRILPLRGLGVNIVDDIDFSQVMSETDFIDLYVRRCTMLGDGDLQAGARKLVSF